MTDPILDQVAANVRQAKIQRAEIARRIDILQRMGGNIGSAQTDLHNIDIMIAKQLKVLHEEGYKEI
jgi:hypothetical protein